MTLELAAGDLPDGGTGAAEVEVDGHRFRRPTSRDLAALAGRARRRGGGVAAVPGLRARARGAARGRGARGADAAGGGGARRGGPLGRPDARRRLPGLRRGAARSALDVPGLVWDEVDAVARRLVDEVHALASAYGWAERDILAMGAARRAAYLARVGA